MTKIGRKTKIWIKARKELKKEYEERGIVFCERCGSHWNLSFHHLEKRSRTNGGIHTFDSTRLLCLACHGRVEYDKEENQKLYEIRI